MADSPARPPLVRPLGLALGAAFAAAAVALPLAPEPLRPWGWAAFGAVGLYAAARGGRAGLLLGLALGLGSKLASDLLNYRGHGYDPDYLPFGVPALGLVLYASLAVYPLLGWAALRRTSHPVPVAVTALAASVQFFLVTNFASWLHQDLPYPLTVDGLLQSYWLGLPFWKGTLLSDVTFTAVLFGLDAALSRVAAPAPVPADAPRS